MIGKIYKFKEGYKTSPEFVGTFVIILSIEKEEAVYRYRIMHYTNHIYNHNIETRNIKCLEEVI